MSSMTRYSDLVPPNQPEKPFSLDVPPLPNGLKFAIFPTSGFLHSYNGEWFVTSKDRMTVQSLPDYIKNRDTAITFLGHAYHYYRQGVEMGFIND